jgi:hypothetical protein
MLDWFRNMFKPKNKGKEVEVISQHLFPSLENESLPDGSMFQVDYSVDSNLERVLNELQDGINDKQVHKTIMECIDRLIAVRKEFDIYPEINTKSKGIVVDIRSNDINPKEVIASEE